MTTQDKVIRAKMTLLELGEYLQNVSEARRISGVSRQHFYDIKQAYQEGGIEALREKNRRKPNLRNRVAPDVEAEIVRLALEQPAWGQYRFSNELRQKGIMISPGGVRGVLLRHGIETIKKRLRKLEEKAAQEGILFTEAQVVALERYKRDLDTNPEEIETHHPGYLVAQDTFYVGFLKGVGRIYQQTVIDTYSAVAFAKLYTSKVPVMAADALNDRALPFFQAEGVPVLRILTDRGTEYCGRLDHHPYELFLELNEIDHTKTKAHHPQTNGICERFHKTVLTEFYQVAFRKKIYSSLEEIQADLDEFMRHYNTERTHQGKRCQGRTPMQTFVDGKEVLKQKWIA